jgi:hypothetical protein
VTFVLLGCFETTAAIRPRAIVHIKITLSLRSFTIGSGLVITALDMGPVLTRILSCPTAPRKMATCSWTSP